MIWDMILKAMASDSWAEVCKVRGGKGYIILSVLNDSKGMFFEVR